MRRTGGRQIYHGDIFPEVSDAARAIARKKLARLATVESHSCKFGVAMAEIIQPVGAGVLSPDVVVKAARAAAEGEDIPQGTLKFRRAARRAL